MTTVTVSPKFQIVIPKLVRERSGIKPGDKLELIERPDGGIAFFMPEAIGIKELRGRFRGGPGFGAIHEERGQDRSDDF